MPIYDSKCEGCGEEGTILVPSSEVENYHKCDSCQEIKAKRIWKSMPGITRASYIDSSKTSRAKEVEPLKRAAKLEVEKAGARPEDRKEIQKEINKLTKLK